MAPSISIHRSHIANSTLGRTSFGLLLGRNVVKRVVVWTIQQQRPCHRQTTAGGFKPPSCRLRSSGPAGHESLEGSGSHTSCSSTPTHTFSLSSLLPSLLLSAALLFGTVRDLPALAQELQVADVADLDLVGAGAQPSTSLLEERLMQAVKAVEVEVDNVVHSVSNNIAELSGWTGNPEVLSGSTQDAHELIQEVYEVVADNFMDARNSGFDAAKWDKLRDEAVSKNYRDRESGHRAVREMLARGVPDPYTRFINPNEFSAMRKYDVTGIGLNLGTGEEFTKKTGLSLPSKAPDALTGVWILGMIKGSPADVAGLHQGDQLLEVDGTQVEGRSPFQVASIISGQPGDSPAESTVQLKVRKPGGEVLSVSVERPERVIGSPVTWRVDYRNSMRVGYVKLSSFNARAQQEMSTALQRLEREGVQQIVLDLRDNRGGLVSEGVEVARLFLEGNATVVVPEGHAKTSDQAVTAVGPALTHLPLMLLVNQNTASASEILAGALQDNCRAVLVGGTTYGKGLIQSVYELQDHSGLVLTVGKYKTPSGRDIDRQGLEPNFKYIPTADKAAEAVEACKVK